MPGDFDLSGLKNKLNGIPNNPVNTLKQKLLSPPVETEKPRSNFSIPQSDLPYGAKGTTKDGLAYYGEGFQGWVRKTYGDLFDPAKRLIDPDEDDWNKYQGTVDKMSQMVDRTLNWDEWGERVFGLSSREAGNAIAALVAPGALNKANLNEKVAAGEMTQTQATLQNLGANISNAVSMTKDIAQRGLWGALEVIGLTDTVMRKVWSVRMGIDTISDKYGKVDSGFWSNTSWTGGIKDIATVASGVLSGEISTEEVKQTIGDTMEGSNAVYSMMLNPDEIGAAKAAGLVTKESFKNIGRFVTGKEIQGVNFAAAKAAYAMQFDTHVQQEFNRRVQAGENPGFVAAELGVPSIELAGSILGDPATYLGLGLLKPSAVGTPMKFLGKEVKIFGVTQRVPWEAAGRIPSFGEMLHLNVAGTRLKKAADNLYFSYADKELYNASKAAFDGANDIGSIEKVKQAISESVKRVTAKINDLAPLPEGATPEMVAAQKAALKRTYSFTAGTASTRARTTAKTMTNVIDMVMSSSASVDEALDTLMDLVRRNNGDELAAQRLWLKGGIGPDGITKGHGALLFSEAGLLTGDMLNRVGPDKIEKIFNQFGGDPAKFGDGLYHALDLALQDVYPTTDEMAKAYQAVKKGSTSLKDVELAQRFKELPASVKTISAIHHKLAKAQGFIVGSQVNLYMKWSPGYASRNVLSQGITVATEMGIGQALETTVNALWKSAVGTVTESFGISKKLDPFERHISNRMAQTLDVLGAVPEGMHRGLGQAGVDITKDKGFLDKFNALNLAQKTEMLTAADIIHGTAIDEIRKAMPAVMSGEASIQTALIDSGVLTDKQGKLLVKYLNDFNGNTEKAILSLKKTIKGNQVESWRNVPIPPKMRQYLESTFNYDEVLRLQSEAGSQAEFVDGVNAMMKKMYEAAKDAAANEPPSIGNTVPDELREVTELIQEQFNAGMVEEGEADLFTRTVQAWQNVEDQLQAATRNIRDDLRDMAKSAGKDIQKWDQELTGSDVKYKKTYRAVKHVLTQTREAVASLENAGADRVKIWNSLTHGIGYDVKNYFPNVDPATSSVKQLKDYIWSAYHDFTPTHWMNANNDRYTETMDILRRWSADVGANFDDVAGMHANADDPMLLLQRAKKEAMELEGMRGHPSLEKFRDVPEGTTLAQMTQTGEFVDANGKKFNRSKIFNTVNAERKAQGLQPYATYGDVPFKEAQNAMKSRMSQFATPAEVVRKVNASIKGTPAAEKFRFDEIKRLATSDPESALGKLWQEALANKKAGEKLNTVSGFATDEEAKLLEEYAKVTGNSDAVFSTMDNIPEDVVRKSVEAQRLPPPFNPDYITPARAHYMAQDGFVEEASKWRDEVSQAWGTFDEVDELPENLEAGISQWKSTFDDRMRIVKDKAMVYATARRDFLLHDYNKTYGDVALGYLMPFQYWSSRTYKQWAEKLVDNPKWASMYLAYKNKNEKEHAGDPAWWRQNVGVNLPGVNNGNPIFFNLEQTINPLNSLTGVDFNDPYKRVDWLSKTVDDLGKMGPAVSTPINWAVALWLYNKGEDEAAKRWMGRLAPATSAIKAGLTKAGVDINLGPLVKHNELDPFVNFLNDGLDPYELNRVNRTLASIVEKETDPEKRALLATQAADAARTHSGALWEQARFEAVDNRANSTLSSFFLGAGFKGRTEEDMKVDQFYAEYHKLLASRDNMPPDEYREAWDKIRDTYKFADALIIGKKSDPERESAYAYNVLGRIPPGQMSGLLAQVGLNNDEINKFYENKGDFSGWSEGDQKRFMAAVVDLGAVLQMPPKSTKQDWNAAKTSYNDIKKQVEKQLGDSDIWDKVQQYRTLQGEARYKGNMYLDEHPEIQQALDMQNRLLTQNPNAFQYYGSLNTIQSYYASENRKVLEQKYGNDIFDKYYRYLDTVDKKEKNRLARELKAFIKEKSSMKDETNRAIVDMATRLPDRPEVAYRGDLTNPTATQQGMIQNLNTPSYVDPQVLWSNTSPVMQELITMYWQEGEKLPNLAAQQLDYLGEQYGISGDEALQIMGIALQGQ